MTASTAQPVHQPDPPPHQELDVSEGTVAVSAALSAVRTTATRIRRKIGQVDEPSRSEHLDEVEAPDVDNVNEHYEARRDLDLEAYGEIVQAASSSH